MFESVAIRAKHVQIWLRIIAPVAINVMNHQYFRLRIKSAIETLYYKVTASHPFLDMRSIFMSLGSVPNSPTFNTAKIASIFPNSGRRPSKQFSTDVADYFYGSNTSHCLVVARARTVFSSCSPPLRHVKLGFAYAARFFDFLVYFTPFIQAFSGTKSERAPSISGNSNPISTLLALTQNRGYSYAPSQRLV